MKIRIGLILSCAILSTSAFGLELKEVQSALSTKRASWTAGETGAHEALGLDSKRDNPFGLQEWDLPIEENDAEVAPAAILPATWDWRNKGGVDYMSPMRNQARCGSCVAFAALGMFEGQLNVTAASPGLDLDLSEQDLFGDIGACEMGSTPYEAMSSLKSRGVPDEACFPYISGRLGEDQDASLACANRSGRLYKALTTTTLTDRTAIKNALMKGPLMTTMTVYEDFMFYTGGVYSHVTGARAGGHAVVLVGWNDMDQAWIVRNSWGTSWGEAGYFRIKYSDISGVGVTGYGLTVRAPTGMTKLTNPQHLAGIKGSATLNADQPIAPLGTNAINVAMTGKNGRDAVVIPAGRANAVWNSTRVADGLYEVSSQSTLANGTLGPAFYELVVVANNPQNIQLTVETDFDNSRPVKDRVYFKLKSNESAVPLTSTTLQIRKTDGSVSKSVEIEYPGNESMAGWRTASYPNGVYEIKAVGNLGGVQQFTSNTLTVTVAN